MAFGSTSKVFAFAVLQMGKQAAQKLTADSYKVALFGNTVTPTNGVSTAAHSEYGGSGSTWSTAHEVSGTGYTAGGVAVSSPTWTQSTNVLKFTSAGTPQWTGASFSAYGGLVYDTSHTNEGLCYNSFGGIQTVTSGTFTVTWSATGICKFTC